ncbi:MAG: tetratricopeptide repeat protein [Candidatus Omnitrophica bacterium]|nr:tetratricopeptide repeat protein [Candidatus Omnitrophota bacterium]
MKKFLVMVVGFVFGLTTFASAATYNFGDYKSSTLATKAWDALKQGDVEAVLAYTNKCAELYAAQAKKMQSGLQAYPNGPKEEIFGFWALNDVATCYFIQGEAYRRADMKDQAKAAFKKVMEEFTYGQAWDPNGWFWKPAEAAKEKLAMIDSGNTLDFGDHTSSFLAGQAWKALDKNETAAVVAYTDKVLELYADKAKEMQGSLKEYPWQSREEIFKYWALNDVGTALYIRGEAFRKAGQLKEAKQAYERLVNEFSYAQCWDPQGWFWKPAEPAQQALAELGKV